MNSVEKDYADFGSDRPTVLVLLAIALLCAAFFMSNAYFPDLGPSAERLSSDDPAIRRVAEVTVLEIKLARLAMVVLGCAAGLLWMFWRQTVQTRFVLWVQAHKPQPLYRPATLNRSLAVTLGGAIFFFAWIAAGGMNPRLFPRALGLEDGPIEYATAVLFGLTAITMFLASRHASGWRRVVMVLMSLGFLLCLFEEISWGQRLLNYATPEPVLALNAQGEFNLHNSLGYSADHIFMVLIVAYGVILPVLAYRFAFFHNAVDLTGIPIPSLGLAIGFAVASCFHGWTVYAVLPRVHLNVAEVREFLSALGLMMLAVETRELARRRRK